MEHQLNNPLRPTVRTQKSEASTAIDTPARTTQSQPQLQKTESQTVVQKTPPKGEGRSQLKPEVRKALDAINAPDELRKLMLQLSNSGIEIAGPKKVYVKHSYEIDQDLHQKFHEMYPVLGFKKVKEAINDAIALWCDQNEEEYRRRNNSKK